MDSRQQQQQQQRQQQQGYQVNGQGQYPNQQQQQQQQQQQPYVPTASQQQYAAHAASQQQYSQYYQPQQPAAQVNGGAPNSTQPDDIQAAIMREQSIVVPTMSQGMANEFLERNAERMGRLSLNPFDTDSRTQSKASQPVSLKNDPPVPQAVSPAPRNVEQEDVQLVDVVVGHLSAKEVSAQMAHLNEVDSAIYSKTGQAWNTHWHPFHGPLVEFIRRHQEKFVLVQDMFVVLKMNPGQASSAPVSSPPQQYYTPNPYSTSPAPAPSTNPFYDATSSFQQQQQPAPQTFSVPLYEEQGQFPNVPFPHNAVALNSGAPNYAQSTSAPIATKSDDDGWVLFDDKLDSAPIDDSSTNPFNWAAGAATATAFEQQLADDANPLAAFESPEDAQKDAERKARKAARKEEKKRKKQEEQDEALARRLQEEERQDAAFAQLQRAGVSASGQSNASASPRAGSGTETGTGTRASLLKDEVRELAEHEVGKDNIRILAGFTITKIGQKGRPSQRKMWINSALTHLAWESKSFLDGSDHRGLELASVTRIRVGEMTPTIRRCTSDWRKVKALCFSLDSPDRTLDLQACSVIQRDALAAALKKVLEFNHKHKPKRLDKERTALTLFA